MTGWQFDPARLDSRIAVPQGRSMFPERSNRCADELRSIVDAEVRDLLDAVSRGEF